MELKWEWRRRNTALWGLSSFYSGLSRCHCTIVCLGFVIISCQCFVSDAPEPFFPVKERENQIWAFSKIACISILIQCPIDGIHVTFSISKCHLVFDLLGYNNIIGHIFPIVHFLEALQPIALNSNT